MLRLSIPLFHNATRATRTYRSVHPGVDARGANPKRQYRLYHVMEADKLRRRQQRRTGTARLMHGQ